MINAHGALLYLTEEIGMGNDLVLINPVTKKNKSAGVVYLGELSDKGTRVGNRVFVAEPAFLGSRFRASGLAGAAERQLDELIRFEERSCLSENPRRVVRGAESVVTPIRAGLESEKRLSRIVRVLGDRGSFCARSLGAQHFARAFTWRLASRRRRGVTMTSLSYLVRSAVFHLPSIISWRICAAVLPC